MADVTAGRSAGSKFNATLDPMRPIVTDAAPGDSQAPSFGILTSPRAGQQERRGTQRRIQP